MVRRSLLAAVVVACVGVQIWAAERATFILSDGSRQSGEVVFHGSGNRNIIDNFLNLGDGGQEKTFPMDQVAIIDFAGGEPSAGEFQQLPADQGHLLVLRGGNMQRGKLLNLINGDTVQWQNEGGQAQQYSIRDVARIILSAGAARRIYPQVATAAASAPAVASGRVDQPLAQGAIRVNANQAWQSSGVRVLKGQLMAFSTNGQVQFSADQGHVAGPDGNPAVQVPNLPVAGMSVGGLIGRVGDSQPFPIGSNQEAIAMPTGGQLMLGINDSNVTDNSGYFGVTLSSPRRR